MNARQLDRTTQRDLNLGTAIFVALLLLLSCIPAIGWITSILGMGLGVWGVVQMLHQDTSRTPDVAYFFRAQGISRSAQARMRALSLIRFLGLIGVCCILMQVVSAISYYIFNDPFSDSAKPNLGLVDFLLGGYTAFALITVCILWSICNLCAAVAFLVTYAGWHRFFITAFCLLTMLVLLSQGPVIYGFATILFTPSGYGQAALVLAIASTVPLSALTIYASSPLAARLLQRR
ncbi:hypothetical protein ACUH96_04765 [Dermabacteraceae bacterium P13077]|nr:hypothetical protein [Dermabacteraceae bacterium TAE3-ERU5]